ncbi:MAG TPA: hypothetical protein PKC98_22090, partial [Candidatus Melainabacteria bacterium]|nr:hypothetical protein [Candidatus Melainabacteria bacterium]
FSDDDDEEDDEEDSGEEVDPNLDFAPDVKSLQDVRPSGNTELAKLNNFDKIIQLGRKHAGRDSTSMKVLEDAFE